MLKISLYDGKYTDDMSSLAHICDIEGSVVPHDRPPFSPLEEALRVLEMCADKYATPPLSSDCLTVFVGRKSGAEVEPLARLDIVARGGLAHASITSGADHSRHEAVTTSCQADDDCSVIVSGVLRAILEESTALRSGPIARRAEFL